MPTKVSSAEWCTDISGAVLLSKPRGTLVQRLGFSCGGRQYLWLEEAAWLAGRRLLRMSNPLVCTHRAGDHRQTDGMVGNQSHKRETKSEQNCHASTMTALLATGYRLEVFQVYAMLSDQGFLVRTRRGPVPATIDQEQIDDPDPKRRRVGNSDGDVTIKSATAAASVKMPAHAPLGPGAAHLEVWSIPAGGIRRANPGDPSFVVSVCSPMSPPPSMRALAALAEAMKPNKVRYALTSGTEKPLLLAIELVSTIDARCDS